MYKAWLASSLLPSEFWWFAIKRATEMANYIPIRINGKLTTPHELVYHQKPDLRHLLPLFAVSYPSYESPHSTDTQTTRAILVGHSNITNSYEFYCPSTKRIITTPLFRLDESLPAGPTFNLPYDGGMYFNKYNESNDSQRPPTYNIQTTVIYSQNNKQYICEVIATPSPINTIYTVQFEDGSIHQVPESDLSLYTSPHHTEQPTNTLLTWIKNKCKATLYLPHMAKPKQGFLVVNNNMWEFRPKSKSNQTPITLPSLPIRANELISTFQLHKGHKPIHKTQQTRNTILLIKYSRKTYIRHESTILQCSHITTTQKLNTK